MSLKDILFGNRRAREDKLDISASEDSQDIAEIARRRSYKQDRANRLLGWEKRLSYSSDRRILSLREFDDDAIFDNSDDGHY